jgi:hypothetical protein
VRGRTVRAGRAAYGEASFKYAMQGGSMNTSATSNSTTDKLYIVTSIVIILGYLSYFLLR